MNIDFGNDEVIDRHYELLKEATAFKKTDINKSIELIKEAVILVFTLDSNFKLANYLYDAGFINECYQIFDDLLARYSYNSFSEMKNMNRSEIYEKLSIIKFKDKLYQDYIISSSLQFYNWIIGIAIQNRMSEIEEMLNCVPIIGFSAETKIEKSFTQLGLNDKKDEIIANIDSYFIKNKSMLLELTRKSDTSQIVNNKYYEGTIGEVNDKLLSDNQEFVNCYNMFNENEFQHILQNHFIKYLI